MIEEFYVNADECWSIDRGDDALQVVAITSEVKQAESGKDKGYMSRLTLALGCSVISRRSETEDNFFDPGEGREASGHRLR